MMKDSHYREFKYKGHHVQVCRRYVPGGWLGDPNMAFSVMIDDCSTRVPGIWNAYQSDGEKGVDLVIKAYLDHRH